MGATFSLAIFGNGIVAILAGVVASFISIQFGYVAPFMLAMIFLTASAVYVSFYWTENYGDAKVELASLFSGGISAIRSGIFIFVTSFFDDV